jgi:hypothetical protein
MGLFDNLFGGGSTTTTSESVLDPASQLYQGNMRNQANNAADLMRNRGQSFFPGFNDWFSQGAQGALGGMGMGGMAAMQGLQGGLQTGMGGIGQYLSPYLGGQLEAMRGEHQYNLGLGNKAVNDQFTQGGAFGGSRHGVAQGTMAARLGQQHAGNVANLYGNAYNQAGNAMMMDRSRMGNLGMGGLGSMFQGAGLAGQFSGQQQGMDQMQAQEDLWRRQQAQNFYQQGFGPYGMSGTSTETTQGGSPLGGLLGLGLTGASMFFPPAGAAMAATGGLSGLGGSGLGGQIWPG